MVLPSCMLLHALVVWEVWKTYIIPIEFWSNYLLFIMTIYFGIQPVLEIIKFKQSFLFIFEFLSSSSLWYSLLSSC